MTANRFTAWWRGMRQLEASDAARPEVTAISGSRCGTAPGWDTPRKHLLGAKHPPKRRSQAARAAGVVLFVLFGAAGAVGAAAGFLFGLPRSRVADMTTLRQSVGNTSGAASNLPPSTSYLANSNLIKVSDWLTTIIIGLGLVNLRKAPAAVEQLALR